MSAVTPLPTRTPPPACARCGTGCLHCVVADLTHTQTPPADPQPERDFYTIAEIAERLSVSDDTVSRLIASGDLPTVRVRGAVRISADDYREFTHQLRSKR